MALSAGARGAQGAAGVPAPPRYGLLLVSAVASIAVQGMAPPGPVQQVLVTALAGAALLLAVRAARARPWIVRLAAGAVAACLAVSLVRAAGGGIGDGAARAMNAALLAFGPPAVALGVVRDLRSTGHARIEAVMGVLALYMLIGQVFAFIYGAIDRLSTTPLFAGGDTATVSHCIYYSFITLTTVGYGDFVTATDVGHTLSLFEALLGQIYLVTVVSLLVSNLGRRPGSPAQR